jgi:hypothetical protein
MKEGVSKKSYRGRNLIELIYIWQLQIFMSLAIRVTIKDILHCNRKK